MSTYTYELMHISTNTCIYKSLHIPHELIYIQPIADSVARNLEVISKTFSTHQTSANGIYDSY